MSRIAFRAAMEPDGFSLQHDVVSTEAWLSLEQWMLQSQLEWEDNRSNQHRPAAQFGFRYNYQKDVVDTSAKTPPIPDIVQRLLLDPIRNDSIIVPDGDTAVDWNFTQCIINDYQDANTIIPWHKDDTAFGNVVLVYTFLDDRPLHLRLLRAKDSPNSNSDDPDACVDASGTGSDNDNNDDFVFFTAHPRHCSRYILRGPAREVWEHSVPSGKDRRVSFTFRTLRNKDDGIPENRCC